MGLGGIIMSVTALAAVLMPVWIIWIVFHYKYKDKQNAADLSAEEGNQISELNAMAEKMAERIKTLETILDTQTPEWRDFDGKE